MIEPLPQQQPSRLVPVLIGGVAMAVVSAIPIINLVNCACCAGIMGSAILAVWFHKKAFGPQDPFTVGMATLTGTLSGLIGGALYTIVELVEMGFFSPNFMDAFNGQMNVALEEMARTPNATPELIETTKQVMQSLASTPALFALIIFGVSVLLFTIFGALGGLIGGAIFKRKPAPMYPPFQ